MPRGGGGGVVEEDFIRVTCNASLAATTLDYELVDGGETLSIVSEFDEVFELDRLSGSPQDVFGSWFTGSDTVPGPPELTVESIFHVESSSVVAESRCSVLGQTITATARSAATITDTTIEILESDFDETTRDIAQ